MKLKLSKEACLVKASVELPNFMILSLLKDVDSSMAIARTCSTVLSRLSFPLRNTHYILIYACLRDVSIETIRKDLLG